MRITGLRATPVAVPFRHEERWAYGGRDGLISVLLEVDTDEGVVGLGEAGAYPAAEVVLAVIRSIEPFVVGEDPFNVERIMRRIHIVGTWHHVKATNPGIAAVEMACWDIAGKVCGQPLLNLFGGRVHDRVEIVSYVSRPTPAEVAEDAKRYRDAGFRSFYLKVGSDSLRDDVERVEALRDGAGPDARIRVDANEAWSPATAIRAIREMERYDLEFAEQPVSGRNLQEMAYVRGQVATPILANEASWTRYDQLDVIRYGAADAVSVDNQMDGGLLNMKRSAGLCEVAGLPTVKHSLGELGVATSAAVHLIAATSTFVHANQAYVSLLADDVIVDSPLPAAAGFLDVPSAPGIGVELDRERVERYADEYRRNASQYAFAGPGTDAPSPLLPKR